MSELLSTNRDGLERWAGCKSCHAIWQRLISEQQSEDTLGSFYAVLSASCPHHKPLLQAFYDFLGCEDYEDYRSPASVDVGFWRGSKGQHVHLSSSCSTLSWSLGLVKNNLVPNHPGTVRILDPDWADLQTLNMWKDACISSHGALCHNPFKIWHARPAWLIDIERECLVPGSVEGNYVALSYTYGDRIGRLINATVRERLQVPHALRDPLLSEYIPAILLKAAYLASTTGERYLWVDAVCIPHENKESATNQLRLMGAIYANAILTIIAADGDSLTGLAGLKGVSEPRRLEQNVITFRDEKLLRREHASFDNEAWKPYYERGWIFQELRLSTRKVVFQDSKLYWRCQCTTWLEESTPTTRIERRSNKDNQFKVLLAGFFDWETFKLLVRDYNTLALRYDEDALPAISGYLSVMSRVFKGGFLYGIPEMIFERGLGWKPDHWDINLERRVRSSRSHETQLTPAGLPSWSWIGWKGRVDPGYNEATRVGARGVIEESTPITEWYTSRSPDDPPQQWRRIESTWYKTRDSYKDFTKPLPPGWTRHDAPDRSPGQNGPHFYPDGCEKYVFQHESMPHDEMSTTSSNLSTEGYWYKPQKLTTSSRNWYYPFPIPEVSEATQPDMPEQTEYLFCKTTRAELLGFQSEDKGNVADLYNKHNIYVGSLDL
ncbi:hypothetical protein ACLX1H_002954 [Fusarium chlamydosporum]